MSLDRPVEKFFLTKSVDEQARTISAVISAKEVDRDGDVVLPSAFGARLDTYRQNPVVTFVHNVWTYTVGKSSNFEITDEEFSADITFAETEEGEKLWTLYRTRCMNAFSAGFSAIRATKTPVLPGQTGYTFEEVELMEIACVPVPSNRTALRKLFEGLGFIRKGFDFLGSSESVVMPYQDLPISEAAAWDEGEALVRVKEWATENGVVDWGKYRRAFLWCDTSKPDRAESYLLPIADVIGDELTVVSRAVVRVMEKLNGSGGGVSIPDDDRKEIHNGHILRYAERSDRVSKLPGLRSFAEVAFEREELRTTLAEVTRRWRNDGE